MSGHKYKFSVVMPIYNVEKYLEEAIESVINQTIGFKENIQLILVNDGSKDKSEQICLKYEKIFPDNIVYISQKNAGVSHARNKGMKYIEGKYVNFLDSDDKWSLDTFEIVYKFFEKNFNEIDVAVCRKKFFEAKENYHKLDYKFKKTKVVDIFEDYKYIHLHITSAFIKSEVAKQYKFNDNLKYGEDSNYINEIILDKKKYGVISEALHFYRRRLDESSAVQNKEKSEEWYTKTIEYFYNNLINRSIEKCGKVIPYIQYLIMYDLQWRINTLIDDSISAELKEKYVKNIIEILKVIEDYIICEQTNIFSEHKIFILSLKYGRDIRHELKYKKGRLYFYNLPIFRIRNNQSIFKIDILNINNGNLILEGRVNCSLPKEDYKIYANINSKDRILLELIDAKKSINTKNTYCMTGEQILYHYTYKVEIPLENIKKVNIIFKYKEESENRLSINFGRFSKLSKINNSYYTKNEFLLKYKSKNMHICKNRKITRIKNELNYLKEIINKKEFLCIFYRIIYFILNKFNKKEIWLISDREDKANDNGEDLFKYIQKQKNKKIKSYFLLDKKSEDYKRLKQVGKVINPGTLKHKIYFLMASKIISSQANDYVINAFGKNENYFRDLNNFDFIFLQHGVTKDDLSDWLKKYEKNIRLFITVSPNEYNSIVNGDYYYTEKQVVLTGFPRYDKLINNKKNTIIILPTQRRKLVEWNPNDKNDNSYNPFFKDSDCFKFYNQLINDERILKVLKDKKYKMKLALHPLHQKQCKDFKANDFVDIVEGAVNYQKEFGENSLMVTDYSSVAFDFAYLKKPVIYTQFDRDTFFEGQVYDVGYFDYEKNGFGQVCYDYESTVNAIIKSIQSDCKLQQKYLKRIEEFYYKFDTDNCKRVYEEILKL